MLGEEGLEDTRAVLPEFLSFKERDLCPVLMAKASKKAYE